MGPSTFRLPSFNPTDDWQNEVVRLSKRDFAYEYVFLKFMEGWQHPHKDDPIVHAIYEIRHAENSLDSYLEYREQVLDSSPSLFFDVEDMLFHGTTRSCLLVEDEFKTGYCGNEDCPLCKIVKSSFDVAQSGTKTKFSRFGVGIYTTSCSSKADDYVHSENDGAVFNVMLACRVASGRRFYPSINMKELVEPPSGFHSVQGDPDHHHGLNYPETVVYDNDAIRPTYLIVYEY